MALTRTVPGFHPEITSETKVAFPIDEQMFDLSDLTNEDRKYMESYKKSLGIQNDQDAETIEE